MGICPIPPTPPAAAGVELTASDSPLAFTVSLSPLKGLSIGVSPASTISGSGIPTPPIFGASGSGIPTPPVFGGSG